MPDLVLAIDAGGTFFKSALVADGHILNDTMRSEPVNSAGPAEPILAAYRTIVHQALARAGRIAGIGVATPGPFDYAAGMSRMTHKFQSILGLDLREAMRNGTGLPADVPIRFAHDAHAFLLGEYRHGAAQGFANVACITLGTGIGSGWIINHQLRTNEVGGPLVRLFTLPCEGATLEDFASGRGIVAAYGQGSHLTAKEIARRAREEHDRQAQDVFAKLGTRIGKTIAPLIAHYQIECLIFGGQIANNFDLFGNSVAATLDRGVIRQAQHIDTAALIGAAGECHAVSEMGLRE
jgi:glucokinase